MMDWIGHHGDIAQWGLGTEYTGPVEIEPVNSEWPKEGIWNAPTSYKFVCTFENGVKIMHRPTTGRCRRAWAPSGSATRDGCGSIAAGSTPSPRACCR